MPEAAGAWCPARTRFTRLRHAIDWGYARFALAVVATLLLALHVAMGRA